MPTANLSILKLQGSGSAQKKSKSKDIMRAKAINQLHKDSVTSNSRLQKNALQTDVLM